MSKKVIITGVTGQLGSYFVDYLLTNTNHQLIGTIRRLSVKNHENISHIKDSRFSLEYMDLMDGHSIDALVQKYKPDYWVNCAANSFIGTSWDLPLQHMEYNAVGVLHILEAIRKYSSTTKFVNLGTSEEFADAQYTPQDEKHPLLPKSPYAASKCAARHIVRVWRESYKLYAIQNWTFNFESPRRGFEFLPRKCSMGVARISKALKENKPFEPLVVGNIYSKRSWQHCSDVCDGLWRTLNQEYYRKDIKYSKSIQTELQKIQNLSPQLKEYVLSAIDTHTVKEFIELAFKYASFENCYWKGEGINETYNQEDKVLVKISQEFFRPADVQLLHGCSSLIKKELDWQPKYSFQDLVKEMVESDLSKI